MNKDELKAYDAMMDENNRLRSINKKRLDPSLVVTREEMRDLIYMLRARADSADDQALKWEKDYGESEREYQRSLQVGMSLGLTAAANALGGWLSDGRP